MKKILGIIAVNVMLVLFSPLALAETDKQIAVVNVTELFNTSAYVQKANKKPVTCIICKLPASIIHKLINYFFII